MDFVTSSCIKDSKKIAEVVRTLADFGFKNIELSGGTKYEGDVTDILLQLKNQFNLNLLCHNYFPSPETPFVANLASLNEDIHSLTLNHFKRSIDLSVALGADRFGLHAGFYTDIFLNQIGKNIQKQELYDKEKAQNKFCKSFEELLDYADGRTKLYIENNVIAQHNYDNYGGVNFFMLTNVDEYEELAKKIEFDILLDVAHLYVSSKTLGTNFKEEINYLADQTDYIHISDNDGRKDLNWALKKDSEVTKSLDSIKKEGKIFTFEIYDSLENIKESIDYFRK